MFLRLCEPRDIREVDSLPYTNEGVPYQVGMIFDGSLDSIYIPRTASSIIWRSKSYYYQVYEFKILKRPKS